MPEANNLELARQWLVVAATIFVAELADKTQLTAFTFASTSKLGPVQVWLACCAGLAAATGLAVFAAGWLQPFVATYNLNRLAGALFVGIGLWMLLRS